MDKFINIEKAIADKNTKLLKIIPKFAVKWIERLIHQDAINVFMEENANSTGIEFATNSSSYLHTSFEAINEQNIPKQGRYIMTCNHPLGGPDGLALISLMGQYRTDIKFPVNDLLMQLYQMKDIFVPLNKFGKNGQNSANLLNDVFAGDDLVIYFPAGSCSRKYNGIVCDQDWKKTIITKAKNYKRDIIPVFFSGKNSNRFYNIAKWRTKLKIKVNLEMFFLPDEMFKQRGNKFFIIFGKPVPYTHFDNSKTDKEWAEWLKKQSYLLEDQLVKK